MHHPTCAHLPQALIMSLLLGATVVTSLTLNIDAVLHLMGLDPETSPSHLMDMAREFLAVRSEIFVCVAMIPSLSLRQ